MLNAIGIEGVCWAGHVIRSVDLNAKLNESQKFVNPNFSLSTD